MKTSLLFLALLAATGHASAAPLRVGVAGLTHTHVHWLLGRPERGDVQIVGVAEPNRDLAARFLAQHNLPMSLWYPSLQEMLDKARPEAVTAFGSIRQHLEVVQACAPRGIHVMVEKPLALDSAQARRMAELARAHHVQLLTNYETTWYATNLRAFELVRAGKLGALRKVVAHDGHQGPKEIGVNAEFLDWLTDPRENGGGAVTDFGCYGANLMTWLAGGRKPRAVTAVLQTFKPDVYPKVDDDATVVLEYPDMQGIIEASWNWPFSRKDLEVYGATGYALSDSRSTLRVRLPGDAAERTETLGDRAAPLDDPFAMLAAVVQGRVTLAPYDPSSLENNLVVMEILDAARESARTGKLVHLP